MLKVPRQSKPGHKGLVSSRPGAVYLYPQNWEVELRGRGIQRRNQLLSKSEASLGFEICLRTPSQLRLFRHVFKDRYLNLLDLAVGAQELTLQLLSVKLTLRKPNLMSNSG